MYYSPHALFFSDGKLDIHSLLDLEKLRLNLDIVNSGFRDLVWKWRLLKFPKCECEILPLKRI